MNVKEQKREWRKKMLKHRFTLNPNDKNRYDGKVCELLKQIISANNYQVIHAYIPIAGEIDIAPLLEDLLAENKTVVCPKTLPKRRMENRILKSLSQLKTGIMGTRHPSDTEIYEGKFDLVIVPGLAYDSQNYRLGYGGAYYDTFLTEHPEARKMGVFYPFQQIEEVPLESHDEQLDEVITFSF